MKVHEIVSITAGRLISGSPDADISLDTISSDSRTIGRGHIFIALCGKTFDGNAFAKTALANGASGAIVSAAMPENVCRNKVVIRVKDTTKALQDIAHHNRLKYSIPFIAITGSSGKTTMKEMAALVLGKRYQVLKSDGTKNNHIGVPETLLKLRARDEMAILELGTNHHGEIRLLGEIVSPTIAIISNIGPSHLEFFKDLEGVSRAKREVMEHLLPNGLLLLNGDDPYLKKIRTKHFNIQRFGFGSDNEIRATSYEIGRKCIRFTVNRRQEYRIDALGVHTIYNALAAIALGEHFNIPANAIRSAIMSYIPDERRLSVRTIHGVDCINDTYNSNPLSMRCAIEVLARYPARARWLVSADMLELGAKKKEFHKDIGRQAASHGIDGLIAFGELSRYALAQAKASGMAKSALWQCSSHAEIADILRNITKAGDAVLVKGSRGMKMEKVLEIFECKKGRS